MKISGSTLATWLRQNRWALHAGIVLFWMAVFLLPYVAASVIASLQAAKKMSQEFEPGYLLRPLTTVDFAFSDTLARHGRRAAPEPDIVFLGIDDASNRLDSLDPGDIKSNRILSLMTTTWPWPREIYAALLDRLCDSGAKVVVFDILFASTTADDPLLKASLDRHADKVVIGCNFLALGQLTLPSPSLIHTGLPIEPRTAFVNFWPDVDGVIRRARFHEPYSGAAIGEVDSKYEVDSIAARVAKVIGKGDLVPADQKDHLFRFGGQGSMFNPISVYQIFYPRTWDLDFQDGAFFKDKIVMIGPSGNFRQDQHETPVSSMDGAQIHLQALNAILHHEFLFYTGDSLTWTALLVGISGAAAWMLGVTTYRAATYAFVAVAFCAAYLVSAIPLYSWGIILSVAAPLGTFFASTLTGLSGQYILEQFERARTRRFFERYVSPKVVREILDNPALYQESLTGRRREVTVLFSDLRGFTSMTENADPGQLVPELNEYLQEMTTALFDQNGILDKFIGDAVMAVWGSFHPEPVADTKNAVKAALAMSRALIALNLRRGERGRGALGMGIGIHHGEAIVGDIGSENAKNFTVIGDTVNLASRLEGVTKEYGVELVISETVEKLVRPFFHLQTLGFEVVKGRQRPVGIYTVLGSKDETLAPERAAYLEQFEAAMKAYLGRDFVVARQGFAACVQLAATDKVSSVFISRCVEYEENPPLENWDGSHTMTRK